MIDADKNMVRIVVDAFRGRSAGAGDRSPALIDYGRGLLGLPEQSPEAAEWRGFWCGFGAGVAFMRGGTEQK